MRGVARHVVLMLGLSSLPACDVVFGLSGEPADAGPDTAPPPDESIGDVPCSSIYMIGNDFDDGEYRTSFPLAAPSQDVAITNGRLTMNNLANEYVFLDTVYFYDAETQPITFRFGDTGIAPGNGSFAQIRIAGDVTAKAVVIDRADDKLVFSVVNGAEQVEVASLAYVPSEHAYVKVELSNDTVALATSADGTTWNPLATRTLSNVRFVHMSVNTYRSLAGDPLTFYVDDLMGGRRAGEACRARELNDDFEFPKLLPKWVAEADHSTGDIDNGEYVMTTEPVFPMDAYSHSLRSGRLYNLVDDEVTIEIPQMVETGTSTQLFAFRINTRSQDSIDIYQQGGALTSTLTKPGAGAIIADSGTYDPIAMRWWRLRNAGGMTYWEVSPDGVTWALRAARPGVQGLEAAGLLLQLYSTSGSAAQVRIDNVNKLPP